MSNDNDRFDRRKMLKTTAIGLTGGSAFTTVGAAKRRPDSDGRDRGPHGQGHRKPNGDGHGQYDKCETVEVLSEDDTHTIIEVDREDETYVYRVNKERGSVEFVGRGDETEVNGGVSTMNHDEILERSTLDVDNEGNCPSWTYSTDYSVVFAVETGDSLDDYPSGVLEGALCAAIGAYAGGPAGAALGAIVCFSVGYFFLSHIDLSGRSLSISAWDCHQGWLNEPSVCTGAIASYTTIHRNLVQSERIPGTHLSMGNSIKTYL